MGSSPSLTHPSHGQAIQWPPARRGRPSCPQGEGSQIHGSWIPWVFSSRNQSAEPDDPAPSLRGRPPRRRAGGLSALPAPTQQTGPGGPSGGHRGASNQGPEPGAVSRAGPGPGLCLRHPRAPAEPSGKTRLCHCPPITMSPQLLPAPRVGPGFRTGPRQFQRSEGERGASSEGQRGAHPAPRAEGRSFHVWPSWKSPPPRASDSVWRVGQGTRGHSGALLETAGRPRQLAGPVPSWGTRPGAEGGGTGSGPPPLQCPSRLSLVAGRAPRTGGAGGRAEGARVRGAPAQEQQALKAVDLCEPPGSSGNATLSPLSLCLGAPLGHTHYLQVTPFSSDLESWPVPPAVPEPPAPGPGSGTCFLSPLIAPLPASPTAPATSSHIRK